MAKKPERQSTRPGADVTAALGIGEAEAAGERRTKRRPHEVRRAARLMTITLPSPDWKAYITDKAAELGNMRPSDFVVYCLSFAFAALEDGQLEPPDPSRVRGYHKAGEALDLFWEPGDED